MSRAASLLILFLCSGAAACARSRHSAPQPIPVPKVQSWTPIALKDVPDQDLRRALTDLLMLVDIEVLWPGFGLDDDPAIVVDSREIQRATAYCIGHCLPQVESGGGTLRLWRTAVADPVPPGSVRVASLPEWKLRGNGEVAAIGFQRREQTVTVLLHEHFHLHYQPEYVHSFGDEIRGDAGEPSRLTRVDLEGSYSGSEPVTTELRGECVALTDALRAGNADREMAMAALRRFVAIRDPRRARPDAPSFEEDFWEREEGVPVNLERRVARRMEFADPSLIGTALTSNGCDVIPSVAYFLMLGGLQGAVLDELGDARVWPNRVYPRDGTPAVSLYVLVRELSTESGKR